MFQAFFIVCKKFMFNFWFNILCTVSFRCPVNTLASVDCCGLEHFTSRRRMPPFSHDFIIQKLSSVF
jgi:hypothetical protein